MFVFNRSALPVLLPLAMLVAVVLWSNLPGTDNSASAAAATVEQGTTVAQAIRPGQKGG